MKPAGLLISLFFFISCSRNILLQIPERRPGALTGSGFYKTVAADNWKSRDSLAAAEILSGNLPSFLKKFVPVATQFYDSLQKKNIHLTFYVSPDYLSIGTDDDWARVPLTPMAAQKIADSLHCFLPTRKMVNDIYQAAVVKLEPVPMYAFRDSSPTMYQHHLIIEEQREGRSGLIAGIKKDVVISGKLSRDTKPNRVAIYGWQKQDGKPIQQLYTGHANWYVDYSHGIRLVYRKIKVEGKWMDYEDVLKQLVYRRLLCDEEWCDFFRY
ncbi:MAG TPA: hypothetical protein VMR70_08300 [Flavisolibacter sp.]|nr:hypothetical protein [Flavisolibacter sp.]